MKKIYLISSFLFLLMLIVSYSTYHQFYNIGNIFVIDKTEGFSGYNLKIPSSEVDKAFDGANSYVKTHNSRYHVWSNLSIAFTWISFLLSSIITILAGFAGQINQDIEKNFEFLKETFKKKQRRVQLIGVLAAFAAVSAGISAKAKESSENEKSSAVKAREIIITSYKDIQDAKTDLDARWVIEKLKSATEQ